MNIFCDLGRGLFHPSKKVPSKTSWRTSWTWSPLNELLLPWKATVQWSPGAIPTAEVTAAKFNINWDACRRLPEGKQLRSEDMRTLRISMYIYIYYIYIYVCVCVELVNQKQVPARQLEAGCPFVSPIAWVGDSMLRTLPRCKKLHGWSGVVRISWYGICNWQYIYICIYIYMHIYIYMYYVCNTMSVKIS